jgi:long-chain fatty acid transport protein
MWGKAELARTSVINNSFPPANTPLNLYNLDMTGDGTAWGYNFGILVKSSTNSKVGFSYRSPFNLEIKDGDVDITNISSAPIAFPPSSGKLPGTYPGIVKPASGTLAGNSFSTKGKTTLNLPATAALGFAYKLDRLTVEADADWTFWSSYERLDIDIQDQGALLKDINSDRQWKDVVALRIGAEYRVTGPLALRAGFVYDPTPVPAGTMDAFLPDADRLNYMVGAGYKIGRWTIDGALMYVDKKDRTVNNLAGTGGATFPSYGSGFNGTWTGDAWLAGLDVSYNF